jgi:transcriptional regulator with XRE-family HTH domain
MIKNAREYQITKAQATKFERAIGSAPAPDVDPALAELEREALRSQLADLRGELEEYEALESGKHKVVDVEDLSELPRALIKARIAAGLTQRQLAERLGLKEQQVQRYEATEYSSASLSRLLEVVQALGVKLHQNIVLPTADFSARTLISNLHSVGFDRDFVRERLVVDEDDEDKNAWRTANVVGRVLRLPIANVVRGELGSLRHAASDARFKVSANASEPKLLAYSAYARYLADRVLMSVAPRDVGRLETQPRDVYRILRNDYGGVTFRAALAFVWDRGLPVLPLRDSGAFHGAFWRVNGRGIIVLKQRADSNDRWLIDVLHEYYHAVQTEGAAYAEYVEVEESPLNRRESDEERTATSWATAAALDGREQELAQMCIDEAGGEIPRLKRVVPKVAAREDVPAGVLANYLAYKLARFDGQDWWGTAASLQATSDNPWRLAQNELFARLEMHRLDGLDREILSRALAGNGEAS